MNNFFKKRYELLPQMREYDSISTVWKPYVMFFNKPNIQNNFFSLRVNSSCSIPNIFLNLDDQKTIKNINNVDVEINKKGWHTHTNSWTGSNVLNVHRGKVILKSDLNFNTFDTLSSVILHLIQSIQI